MISRSSKPYNNQWPEDQEKYPGRSDRYRRRMIKRDTEAHMQELSEATCCPDCDLGLTSGEDETI